MKLFASNPFSSATPRHGGIRSYFAFWLIALVAILALLITVAVLQYRFHDKLLWLMHTDVPKKLEGHGVASLLAHTALEWAKETNIKVKVICPFVAVYLKRHPEYDEIVEK